MKKIFFVPLLFLSLPLAAYAEPAQDSDITVGNHGVSFISQDKNYALSLRGTIQIDSRNFINDKNGTGDNDVLARRIRPVLEGRAGNASFRFMPDLADKKIRVFDAHADYTIEDALKIRIGKFKPPVGLERLQSAADTFFIERGYANNLAPSRDLGVMLYGNDAENRWEYQLGIFDGNQDLGNTNNDVDDKKDVIARVFLYPFKSAANDYIKELGVGLAGSYGKREGNLESTILSSYRSAGQQRFFRYQTGSYADGEHWRLYPQAYWYHKNMGVMAEYALSNQAVSRNTDSGELQQHAWNISAGYVLTGEEEHYRGGIKPKANFYPTAGDWGAWELVARIGQMTIDDNSFNRFADGNLSARQATGYAAGVNWYWNENIKLAVNYELTQFNGGASAGNDRPNEQALFARTQLRF